MTAQARGVAVRGIPMGGSYPRECGHHTAVIARRMEQHFLSTEPIRRPLETGEHRLKKERGTLTEPRILDSDIWNQSGYRAADRRALIYQNW